MAAIPLDRRLLGGSSDRTRGLGGPPIPSYLVLLRVGFSMRARSLARRWALTPPFHPYPCGRFVFCATFRGSLRAAVSSHPALWSPDFPPRDGGGRPTRSGRLYYSARRRAMLRPNQASVSLSAS